VVLRPSIMNMPAVYAAGTLILLILDGMLEREYPPATSLRVKEENKCADLCGFRS
jgi:hypothetical protein